ncbi:oligosaccharide flippase family protein [Mesorhizobium sp. CAU 1741]|uniref:oligosaccharide flippase family protein n=1 Tax=Mesorhizobium sp. CAU 1741 TaxID=3140366 RepID=UPI00325C0D4A
MRSQLISGSLWLTGAKVCTTAVGFLSTIILARLLVPEDFGLIAIAAASLAIATAVTDLPVAAALVQLEEPSRADYDTAWTISLLRGLLVMLTLTGVAPLIAAAYGDERLIGVLVALSLSPLLLGGLNPYMVIFDRQLLFSRSFILETVSKVGSVLVSAIVAFQFRNYWALVAGPLAAALIALVLSYALAPYRPRPALASLRVLWGFSSWLTLVSIVNTLNLRLDQFIVGSVLGQRTLGHFSVGSDIANLIHAPVMPIMRTLYAGFSQLRGDRAALFNAYQQSQRFLGNFAPPFGVGLALVAEPMVRITLGDVWVPAAIVIEILAPVFAFELIAGATYPMVMSQGNTRALFWRDLTVLLFRLPLMAIGIIWFGLLGLLIARAAASAFGLALNIQLAQRVIGLTYKDVAAGVWRPLCGVTAMSVIVLGLRSVLDPTAAPLLFILIAIPLGAVVYSTTVLGLWILGGRRQGFEADAFAIGKNLLGRSN